MGLQRPPPVGGKDLLICLIGELRVRERGLALERRVGAGLVQTLVDLGVDAGDEEGGDRVDRREVDALVAGDLETREVRVDDVGTAPG